MNSSNQDLYPMCNMTSILRLNDVESLLKNATVVVFAIIN